ncbi:MAG: hypothetical protein V7749_12735 [Cocleimonas sp.]
MSSASLKVAVVSDLHFVSSEKVKDGNSHSWLSFDTNGKFNDGFWSNLLAKIHTEGIHADILICPGDITTHAEPKALEFAWKKLNELAKVLKCDLLVTATGNHDVSSRPAPLKNVIRDLDHNISMVENLKLLEPPYPLVNLIKNDDELAQKNRIHYFGSDFLIHNESEHYRLVVLNSCGTHSSDPADYERGSISESTLTWLEKSLKTMNCSKNKKLGILVCHHHPILHPDQNLGTYDFMKGGTRLLEMLNNYGNWIVVHGHKHHAKLSYHSVASKKSVVFAAGTLSAHKKTLGDGFANQFYIINTDLTQKRGTPKGTLDVYSWQANCWSLSKRTKDGVFTGVGFGDIGCLEEMAEHIEKQLVSLTSTPWDDIVELFPKLKHMVPLDFKHLIANLQDLNVDVNFSADHELESLERTKA